MILGYTDRTDVATRTQAPYGAPLPIKGYNDAMPKLYRPEEVIKVLESLGWRWVRTTGDHARLVLADGQRPTTVPLSKREVSRRNFQSILHQTGLNREQFEATAEEVL